MTATMERKVPAKAMQFEAELQFADTPSEGTKTAPIKMLGRSAQPVNHWYWGKVIHDMSGFKTDHDKVPIDWSHNSDEGIGYLDKFTANNDGLFVEGELVSIEDGDRSSKIMKKSAAGVPHQASIYFRSEVVEEVQPGASSQVNGYSVEGPATIVRQWSLRGMAVCLYGADHRTKSEFSDDGDQKVAVSYFTSETDVSKDIEKPAEKLTESLQTPAELAENSTENQPEKLTETEPTKAAEDPAKLSADDRSELKRFIAKFGAENGSKWYADNVSFADAMELHIDALNAAAAEKEQAINELQTKLSSIDRGEENPVQFGSSDEADNQEAVPEKFQQLGENVGRFAASIKLPK